MAYIFGAILASGTYLLATIAGLGRDRSFHPTLTMMMAA
jgi:hypothetical protein